MGRDRLAQYALDSPAGRQALDSGLSGAQWFHSEVPRKRLKELMARSDGPAIRDTVIWVGLMVVCAAAGGVLWVHGHPWAAAPLLLVYGVLYGSGGDSRWHEAGHGTAFRTRWMDTGVYQLACFMMMRDPTAYRWGHTRHHTDTLIVGRDPEIQAMRPARLARMLGNLFGLYDVPVSLGKMVLHTAGRLTTDEADTIPEQERFRTYRTARLWSLVYATTLATAMVTSSWLPLLLVGGPRMYGTFMHIIYGLTQHAGLGENVLDHRLNTRSVRMNVVNRFLYWNMNFHVEHHMFPMVPYHRLPELHEQIKGDLAPMYPSIWAAYRELVPAVLRQLKDQSYYVRRDLPPGAAPYYEPAVAVPPSL
ncbi:MAG: fatty acid desaturase [Actinobacteria bacterium]|nr:fatty acid desaturase [Actinomycetota bacterium]